MGSAAGLVAAASLLAATKLTAREAIKIVRRARVDTINGYGQEEYVEKFRRFLDHRHAKTAGDIGDRASTIAAQTKVASALSGGANSSHTEKENHHDRRDSRDTIFCSTNRST